MEPRMNVSNLTNWVFMTALVVACGWLAIDWVSDLAVVQADLTADAINQILH